MVNGRICHCTNWKARNNSANVAAILNPGTCHKTRECYCLGEKVPPQLFSRPKECLSGDCTKNESTVPVAWPKEVQEFFRKPSGTFTDSDGTTLKFFTRRALHGTTTSDTERPSEFFQATREELEDNSKYQFYGDTNGEENAIRTSEENIPKSSSTTSEREFFRTTTEDENRIYGGSASEDDSKDTSKKTNKDLVTFRNDHYFETHSTEDLLQTIPSHTCVHSFDLDDRLLPQALHADGYGTSRCIICGKPMEPPRVHQTDSRDKKKNIFPKYYKYGLAPRKIFMGDGDVKLELEVDCVKGGKKPNYFDTFALRYQKGVA